VRPIRQWILNLFLDRQSPAGGPVTGPWSANESLPIMAEPGVFFSSREEFGDLAPTTVLEIIERYLRANGFDGLYSLDGECGCELGDLEPCCESVTHCRPGYRCPCPPECGDHDWHMCAERPAVLLAKAGEEVEG
jgi:hypothetical protein